MTSRRSRARGYTAIEVLVAMTLFAVGTASVLSLQRASIVGSSDARRNDVATAVGSEWIERLRQDSLAWTLPSAADPGGPSNIATATKLLAPGGTLAVVLGPTGTSDAGAGEQEDGEDDGDAAEAGLDATAEGGSDPSRRKRRSRRRRRGRRPGGAESADTDGSSSPPAAEPPAA